MCGILGIIVNPMSIFPRSHLKGIFSSLLISSESRGKEATGLCIKNAAQTNILKSPQTVHLFQKTQEFKKVFQKLLHPTQLQLNEQLIILGHARLVTNGTQKKKINNQPTESKDLVCVHNGIIVNHEELVEQFPQIDRISELDTEVLLKLINVYLDEGYTLEEATQKTFEEIEGAASIAVFHKKKEEAVIATNTGSLHYSFSEKFGVFIFASEKRFMDSVFSKVSFLKKNKDMFSPLTHLQAGTGIHIAPKQKISFKISLSIPKKTNKQFTIFSPQNLPLFQSQEEDLILKRCTKCILPHTMPFITFDEAGVCSYCKKYKDYKTKSMNDLLKTLEQHKKIDGSFDCVVAFSGGRDSSYGLHLIKKKLQLNPIVLTYDWGVVTDLARRNQSRMCAALGIEQILVSANIEKKRRNIKKNLEAWLQRPELGMIPLLMAGDKHFFYYSKKIARENNIGLIIFCVNPLEKTDFKAGFSGIQQRENILFHRVSTWQKMSLGSYYLKNFFLESKYLNSSLIDTATAYFISYFMKHPYVEIFDYFEWDEDQINNTLLNEYGWETDPTTTTTWRIGDGTAPFYNYIYHHVAGFTENDTLRSNQIRQNIITREEALRLIKEENKPRYEAIQAYLSLINVNFEKTMNIIHSLPKLY